MIWAICSRIWTKKKKRKKRKNLEWSTNKLKELGIDFESKNDGIHLVVKNGANVANFYPSTGRYMVHGGIWKRGINNLIKDMGVNK